MSHSALSPRAQRFLEYVSGECYPCPIGTALARTGDVPVVELAPDDSTLVRAAKLTESVTHLVQKRLSVLLYPHDHVDGEELVADHARVYTPFFTEICLRDLARLHAAGSLTLPQSSVRMMTGEDIGRRIDATFFDNRNIPASPAIDMVRVFGVPLQADLEASREAVRAAVGELIMIEPNIHPVYNGEAIQSILIGPPFPGARGESTAVRPYHDTNDHGRRCSVAALVTNFIPDIDQAMNTADGRAAAARVQAMGAEYPGYQASHVFMGIERQRQLIVRLSPQMVAGLVPPSTKRPVDSARVGRNDRCPCGSGRKYKNCCLRRA